MGLVILYEHYGEMARRHLRDFLAKRNNHRCACCGAKTKRFVLDHCHKTGVIRGAICHRCNNGLGMFGDGKEGLIAAMDYLASSPSQAIIANYPPSNWHDGWRRDPLRDKEIVLRKKILAKTKRPKGAAKPKPDQQHVVFEKLRLVS